jgi:MSHA biogenesis protein MshK
VCKYFMVGFLLCTSMVCAQENSPAQEQNHQEQQEQRDPTRPLDYSAAGKVTGTKAATLRLSSVLISAQRKLAIINGHSLREGQSIPGSNGVILASIKSQGVVLQQAGRTWELRLAPSVIKKK